VEGVVGGISPWDPPSNPPMIKEDVHLMYGVKLLKKKFTLRMLNFTIYSPIVQSTQHKQFAKKILYFYFNHYQVVYSMVTLFFLLWL